MYQTVDYLDLVSNKSPFPVINHFNQLIEQRRRQALRKPLDFRRNPITRRRLFLLVQFGQLQRVVQLLYPFDMRWLFAAVASFKDDPLRRVAAL